MTVDTSKVDLSPMASHPTSYTAQRKVLTDDRPSLPRLRDINFPAASAAEDYQLFSHPTKGSNPP